MDDILATEYKKIRRDEPTVEAKWALFYARDRIRIEAAMALMNLKFQRGAQEANDLMVTFGIDDDIGYSAEETYGVNSPTESDRFEGVGQAGILDGSFVPFNGSKFEIDGWGSWKDYGYKGASKQVKYQAAARSIKHLCDAMAGDHWGSYVLSVAVKRVSTGVEREDALYGVILADTDAGMEDDYVRSELFSMLMGLISELDE